MKKGILGKKIGMTQIFDENGKMIPVTVIEVGPCNVVQKKTVESDGYNALQIGFGDVKVKNVNKPLKGHFDKADVAPKRVLKEFRLEDIESYNVGDIIKTDKFEVAEKVDVTGTSKGKGFAGVIKRWNFSILKASHGTGPNARRGGSIGNCADPGKVIKGHKMAGHLGNKKVTVQNLDVIKVDPENNLIVIRGAVPGAKGSVVSIVDSVKA